MSVRWQVWVIVFVLVLGAGLAVLGWREANNAWTEEPEMTLWHALLFYGSWLMPVFMVLIMSTWRYQKATVSACIALGVLALGGYARFIEPNLLLVKYTTIQTGYTLKLALMSDLHYGLYSTPAQMQRLVDKLNALDVDAVLVAGDWTYNPPVQPSLTEQLKPFRQIRHPVYSVPGNHDEEMPGPPLASALREALLANGVIPIEGRYVDLGQVRLFGVGDLWAKGIQQMHQSVGTLRDKPLLILSHNPDTFARLPKLPQDFVLLAGHTHGGQINLPYLTEKVLALATKQGYQRGLYPLQHGQIFVTSGIGMVWLPLRLAMPPTIDVLEFK